VFRTATTDDATAMYDVNAAYDVLEMGGVELEPSDIHSMLSVEGSETVVAEEAGQVLGFASVARSGEVETVASPTRPDPQQLQRELLAWVLERASARGLGRLEHWAGTRADGAAVVLAEAGFVHARTMWRMTREVTGALPEPVWPAGVSLRPFDRDRDARPVWQLVQRAFAGEYGSHQRPYDEWATYALAEGSDIICAVERDELVGVATVAPRAGAGHVGQLAVDRAARGRGIGLALLCEAFRRDAAAGWSTTTLTVDGENALARRLYEKAGMTAAKEYRRWERPRPRD
jgi:ribosomal protein S18 acetylase RimI-like enzyme